MAMNIENQITALREARNITTNRLANLYGLSQIFVRSVKLGEKGITIESLNLICDTLKISLKDFFDVPKDTPVAEQEELIRMIENLNVRQRESLMAFLKAIIRE